MFHMRLEEVWIDLFLSGRYFKSNLLALRRPIEIRVILGAASRRGPTQATLVSKRVMEYGIRGLFVLVLKLSSYSLCPMFFTHLLLDFHLTIL